MKNTGEITIRKVKSGELSALLEISKTTFFEAFGTQNTQEDMQRYLAGNLGEKQLKSELEQAESQFYFAEWKEKIIGYLKVNKGKAQTEHILDNALEIERIYVLQLYHGKNVGQLLFDKALEIAKEEQKNALWLGVWEKNPRAIRFYEKNGFEQVGEHPFLLGNDLQTDILMRRKLK